MTDAELHRQVAELAAEVADLRARRDIEAVLYRYARAADRADVELFRSCYWPDAIDDHGFFVGSGHAFAEMIVRQLREIPSTQHSITNPLIDLDGDRAVVECRWYVVHRIPLDDVRVLDQQIEGRYVDVVERRGGQWRILHRRCLRDHFREFVVLPVPGTETSAGGRYPEDPVYRGFDLARERPLARSAVPGEAWRAARARHLSVDVR